MATRMMFNTIPLQNLAIKCKIMKMIPSALTYSIDDLTKNNNVTKAVQKRNGGFFKFGWAKGNRVSPNYDATKKSAENCSQLVSSCNVNLKIFDILNRDREFRQEIPKKGKDEKKKSKSI